MAAEAEAAREARAKVLKRMMVFLFVMRMILLMMITEAEATRETRAKVGLMRMMVIWLVMRIILLVMITKAARAARAKVLIVP